MSNLRIAGIENDSITDGPGLRLTIFVQGCPRACPGCHNPQTQTLEGGTLVSSGEIIEKIRSNPLLDGVTFSGGEPFLWASELLEVAQKVKKMNLNLAVYTGFLFEELEKVKGAKELLKLIDVLVDGPFVQEKKDYRLKFKGSTNQRIIDVQKTLLQNKVVLEQSDRWN